ncbi:diaminopimelate epimerase [Cyclonatronum proteinivorum]|uniref:Diaminopimelate epimerase n=2 Tax=Cyclonatronum proteinivorum TaxID=1457365 RepID=A0A345UMC7_9BACT|nr:diaminopimelate epimerase [Cyclonatronum proteinivorum]
MHGAGNDFVVFDNRTYGFLLDEIIALTPRLCHRRFGVGADGVLVLEPSERADYRMVYRNADGSDAGMCGNGARCLARFAVRSGFPEKVSFMVHGSRYEAEVTAQGVTVAFPVEPKPSAPLSLLGREAVAINSGTEHVVTWVESETLQDEPALRDQGREIRNKLELFPTGTNVNFACTARESNQIYLKTYERGVEDLTLACGTGALATAVAHHHKTKPEESGAFTYEILCSGGTLKTSFEYDPGEQRYRTLRLSGPALFTFDGTYFLDI